MVISHSGSDKIFRFDRWGVSMSTDKSADWDRGGVSGLTRYRNLVGLFPEIQGCGGIASVSQSKSGGVGGLYLKAMSDDPKNHLNACHETSN